MIAHLYYLLAIPYKLTYNAHITPPLFSVLSIFSLWTYMYANMYRRSSCISHTFEPKSSCKSLDYDLCSTRNLKHLEIYFIAVFFAGKLKIHEILNTCLIQDLRSYFVWQTGYCALFNYYCALFNYSCALFNYSYTTTKSNCNRKPSFG